MRPEDVEALLEAPLRQLEARREQPLSPVLRPTTDPSRASIDSNKNSTARVLTHDGPVGKNEDNDNDTNNSKGTGVVDNCTMMIESGHRQRGEDRTYSPSRHRRSRSRSRYDDYSYRSERPRHNHRHQSHQNQNRRPSYSRSPPGGNGTLSADHDGPMHHDELKLGTASNNNNGGNDAAVVTAPLGPPDKRTVFVRQIGQRANERDVLEVCERAGRVLSVRLVQDRITRRHKGVAYVEFADEDAVPRALALTGTRLLNIPLLFEVSEADKNRIAAEAAEQQRRLRLVEEQNRSRLCRVIVEQLHPTADESDLRRFFASSSISSIRLHRQRELAQVDFRYAGDARRAVESLDRHTLLGRQVHLRLVSVDEDVVGMMTTTTTTTMAPPTVTPKLAGNDDGEDDDDLGEDGHQATIDATRRTELMLKLARGNSSLSSCLLLTTTTTTNNNSNAKEDSDELRRQLSEFGPILHWTVRAAESAVYVKYGEMAAARAALQALDGRPGSDGRPMRVQFVAPDQYRRLFPAA